MSFNKVFLMWNYKFKGGIDVMVYCLVLLRILEVGFKVDLREMFFLDNFKSC